MMTFLQAAEAVATSEETRMGLWKLFSMGGWLMWPLLALGGGSIGDAARRPVAD
jgi:biopolymer transport protein ExbB